MKFFFKGRYIREAFPDGLLEVHISSNSDPLNKVARNADTDLAVTYCLQRDETTNRELGADYLDRVRGDQLKHYLLKRLERLALRVQIQPATDGRGQLSEEPFFS